jgi:predicted DNA-binding protein (MmcQ/YjbR family)
VSEPRKVSAPTSRAEVLAQCAGLAGAELSYPFGDHTAVYKVGEKMFAMVSLEDTPGSATVKCDPDEAASLRGSHSTITPGYYMNKRHWITIGLGGEVPGELVADLIANSHGLVVDTLPLRLRPGGQERAARSLLIARDEATA